MKVQYDDQTMGTQNNPIKPPELLKVGGAHLGIQKNFTRPKPQTLIFQ